VSKVVQFTEVGGPEVLQIVEKEVAAPGKDEVRITVKAIGLNRAESLFRRGEYFESPVFPATLGYEAAGVVDAIGSEVDGFRAGDAVSVVPNFSLNKYGTYADTIVVSAASLVKQPASLNFETASAVWMAYLTAYDALIGTAKTAEGDFVVIPAASSAVGIASIQTANAIGGVTIALTRTSEKSQQLKDIGAAHVIATEEQDVLAELQKITGGNGVNVVFDPVGGPTFAKLLEAAAPKACIIIYGTLNEPTVMPHFPIFTKSLTITGALLFTTTYDPERLKIAVNWVVKGLASGSLKPVIAKTFPLDQIVEAHRYLQSNKQFGKIVVTV
jgi:NADPH:quinone reductase-like Zn-dependent oxidoreductase